MTAGSFYRNNYIFLNNIPKLKLKIQVLKKMINEGAKFWLRIVKDNVEKNSSFRFEYLRRIEAILENTLACHVMGKLSGKKSGGKNLVTLSL